MVFPCGWPGEVWHNSDVGSWWCSILWLHHGPGGGCHWGGGWGEAGHEETHDAFSCGRSAPLDLSKSGESKRAPDISGLFSRVKTWATNAQKWSKWLTVHKCCVCQYKCKSAQVLYDHMKWVHSDEKLYLCHSCSKSFNIDHDCQVHVNTVHCKHLHCKKCKYVMYNNFRMTNHQRTHDLPKIECPYCNVKLCSNEALHDHIRRHADTTIYSCSQCGKQFSSDASQCIYIQGKHGQGYVCLKCNEHFDSPTQRACHCRACT